MNYVLAFLLIVLGVLMQIGVFNLSDYTLACLNISALFFTIAGICYGSLISKWRTLFIRIVYYITII
ncbi:hypothetical protein, partial [Paenibacillus sp. P46E]|uniref:hypothetical protein n=1 Tax=Paenibacillus sp. P46E TaxID=1349436 RepID=UPI000A9DE95E